MSEIQINCAHDAVVPLAELKPNARNPNLHPDSQIKLLAKIIQHQGWRAPITVSNQTGLIVVGHGRLAAAKLLGLDVVPVDYQDFLSEEDEWAHLLADNRLSELSETDGAVLKDVLLELDSGAFPMDVTGFDERELERVINSYGDHEQDADPQINRAEELQKEWGTETGQLWSIGEHRLLCGDSTKKEDVERVMAGESVETCIADPPYGMKWSADASRFTGGKFGNHPRGREREDVIGDDKPYDPTPLLAFKLAVIWGMNHFCTRLPPGGVIVWIKKPDERFGSFLSDCELAWTNKGHGVYAVRHDWGGITRESERGEFLHPTQKPVAVIMWVIKKTEAGEIIFDPFLGSGTTMVACENLKRKCRGIEIFPGYVAVCLERMKNAFGIKGVLLDA